MKKGLNLFLGAFLLAIGVSDVCSGHYGVGAFSITVGACVLIDRWIKVTE